MDNFRRMIRMKKSDRRRNGKIRNLFNMRKGMSEVVSENVEIVWAY